MIKKKAKRTGKTAKKSGKKKNTGRNTGKKRKELRPAEVRKKVSAMVELEAAKMAKAVIGEGKKGQLATVKYLFEVAEIFPPSVQTTEGSAREDSLAETLLHRLNIPIEPVHNDDDDDEPVNIGQLAVKPDHKDEANDACDEIEPGSEKVNSESEDKAAGGGEGNQREPRES